MTLEHFNGDIASVHFVDFIMVDLLGSLRSVSMPRSYATDKVLKTGIGFDASNYGFAKVSNSDMIAIPDLSVSFVETRGDIRILHIFCDVFTTERERFDQYPRNVVRAARDFVRGRGIADTAKVLVELEFYIFDNVEYASETDQAFYRVTSRGGLGDQFAHRPRTNLKNAYHRMAPEDRYVDFRNNVTQLMETIGIPVKYHHHEVAVSQLEIELDFMDMTYASDMVSTAKWIIRQVAEEYGFTATFMPKPLYNMPGSGMHVHQFLEKDGRSIFHGDRLFNLSESALSYIAGVLTHSLNGSLLAFACPSTNSYRRLVRGYEAPVSAIFAKGSREAAVRIPGYVAREETRVEYRTGDGTSNIYFFLSAMVLAGCDGILKNMDPVVLGYQNFEATEKLIFPLDLSRVLDGLNNDNKYLSPAFPEKLIALWTNIKRREAEYVYNSPSPQEYELYY